MVNLLILESPTKASTIKGYLGSSYKVVACKGHVRDLPKSTLGIDIDNHFEAHYINIRGKGELIRELKKEVKKADRVYLATDPDREGEAISWHLVTALDIPENKAQRITFNEVTKTAVKDAIKKPRAIDMDLVNAQQTRRILDRIVGYKVSPFLWKTVKSGLSAGRVQSVATRIIVERENEIRAFVPTEYWTIEAALETPEKKLLSTKFYGMADTGNKLELPDEAHTMEVVNAITGKPFTVREIKKGKKTKNPAPPFTTSTLQQEASRKLNFQSQRTMKVAQELYEGINLGSEFGGVQGLITYMRTDSLRIADEAREAARTYIQEKYGEDYCASKPRVYKSKANAQDAHEAIRPSGTKLDPASIKKALTSDQYRLYKLIWDRFIASQMESAELATMQIDLVNGPYLFRTSGHTVTFPGFMAVYEETTDEKTDDDEAKALPILHEGDVLTAQEIHPDQHFTEPPARYNEATLIKFLEDKGIGRPSTYTPIITIILQRGYVKREGKSLVPTQLGEVITKIMCEQFPDIVDYAFTASMENQLDAVENGECTMLSVLDNFYAIFKKELDAAMENVSKENVEVPEEETDIICEHCGARMIVKNGRFGKFAACPNYPACKNTKPLTRQGDGLIEKKPEIAPMKCELCGADMILRNGRYGSFYACSRYPECKFTKQKVKELGVKCPECGAELVTKYGKNRTVFYSCSRYPECKFSSWDIPTNEKCPKCGGMLLRKKGKNLLVCRNPECDYRAEAPAETETTEQTDE
ncbi:MAG: type I DNA topoisomerase [Eubacteriales bacterium]|nr:type I DNA topoisomerase [Clostridiales bacterium]MDD7773668.1 type I DNA topoisomerase [Eubacteriales bacterium]MDY3941322.1 type I DNA topoisomerase [Eubacteriales bacterium]